MLCYRFLSKTHVNYEHYINVHLFVAHKRFVPVTQHNGITIVHSLRLPDATICPSRRGAHANGCKKWILSNLSAPKPRKYAVFRAPTD